MTPLPGTAWPAAPADGAPTFVPTPVHGPALATLEGALAGAPGLALVTGAPGTGKTALCRALNASLAADPRHAAGLVADAGALRGDLRLLRGLVFALGQTATGRNGLAMLAELRAGVAALAASGRTATLLVDNAQALGGSQLETLRSLLGDAAARDAAARPAVVLFATPELGDRIARRQGLAGHMVAVVALPPLDRAGLAALLAGHSRIEGTDDPPLSASALDALLAASGGIAGRALPLAAAARAEALALGWEQVDERLVARAATRASARGGGTAAGAPLQDAGALQASLPLGVDDAAGLPLPASPAQLPLLGGEAGGA